MEYLPPSCNPLKPYLKFLTSSGKCSPFHQPVISNWSKEIQDGEKFHIICSVRHGVKTVHICFIFSLENAHYLDLMFENSHGFRPSPTILIAWDPKDVSSLATVAGMVLEEYANNCRKHIRLNFPEIEEILNDMETSGTKFQAACQHKKNIIDVSIVTKILCGQTGVNLDNLSSNKYFCTLNLSYSQTKNKFVRASLNASKNLEDNLNFEQICKIIRRSQFDGLPDFVANLESLIQECIYIMEENLAKRKEFIQALLTTFESAIVEADMINYNSISLMLDGPNEDIVEMVMEIELGDEFLVETDSEEDEIPRMNMPKIIVKGKKESTGATCSKAFDVSDLFCPDTNDLMAALKATIIPRAIKLIYDKLQS